jgi:hypothetical protein
MWNNGYKGGPPGLMRPYTFDQVPEDLARLPHWLHWRWASREGKSTKVPCHPVTGDLWDVRQKTGFTLQQALTAPGWDKANGLGIAFFQDDQLIGIDLDDCRHPETGVLTPQAAAWIDGLKTYAEVSPSQTGVKLWLRGPWVGQRKRRGPVEVYTSNRFFTVTGWRVGPGATVAAPNEVFQAIVSYLEQGTTAQAQKGNLVQVTPADERLEGALIRLRALLATPGLPEDVLVGGPGGDGPVIAALAVESGAAPPRPVAGRDGQRRRGLAGALHLLDLGEGVAAGQEGDEQHEGETDDRGPSHETSRCWWDRQRPPGGQYFFSQAKTSSCQ